MSLSSLAKSYIYSLIGLSVGCMIFCIAPEMVHAQSSVDTLTDANTIVDAAVKVMSWSWILLATLAGKLMTNGMVYGEFIHLDSLLRNIRKITRNLANIGIAVVLIAGFAQMFLDGKDANMSALSKRIIRVGVGSILINISRWLVGFVVDVSGVMTLAVSNIPSMYISGQPEIQSQMIADTKVHKSQTLIREPSKATKTSVQGGIRTVQTTDIYTGMDSSDDVMDMIMPNEKSLAGPLIYMGTTIFRFNTYVSTSIAQSDSVVDTILVTMLKGGILLFFVVALCLLVTISAIRVIYLRFFIACAPLVILGRVSANIGTDIGKSLDEGTKNFLPDSMNVGKMIQLIFAPVITMLVIGLSMMIMATMVNVIQSNNTGNGLLVGDIMMQGDNTSSTLSNAGLFSTQLDGGLFSDVGSAVGNTFTDLLVFALAMVILRAMTIIIVKTQSIGSDILDTVQKTSQKLAGSIPIAKIGGNNVGAGAISKAIGNQYDKVSNKFGRISQDGEDALTQKLDGMMGIENTNMPPDLRNRTTSLTNNRNPRTKDTIQEFLDIGKDLLTKVSESRAANPETRRGMNGLGGLESYGSSFSSNMQKAISTIKSTKDDTRAKEIFGNTYTAATIPVRDATESITDYVDKKLTTDPQRDAFVKRRYTAMGGDYTKVEGKNAKEKMYNIMNKRLMV